MEARTKESASHERRGDRPAREPARADERRDRPPADLHEPGDERTPEEAGYGYGV